MGRKKVLTKDDLVDEEILELSIKTQKQLMVLYALQWSLAHAVLESWNYTSEIKTLQNKSKIIATQQYLKNRCLL